jgi:hypothetical protein
MAELTEKVRHSKSQVDIGPFLDEIYIFDCLEESLADNSWLLYRSLWHCKKNPNMVLEGLIPNRNWTR